MITGRQIRAARGLLGWDATDLAAKAGLTRETVSKIENDSVQAREETVAKIVRAFNDQSVEFIDGQGVRLKPTGIDVYDGADKIEQFYDFLYSHLKRYGGNVCLSIYDENILAKYRKDPNLHRNRMKELFEYGSVSFRIIATKSDFISHGYAKFKYLPDNHATMTGFYAFGDCLALMSFVNVNSPYIIVIQSGPIAEAYRQSFDVSWDNAKEPLQSGRA